MAADMGVAFLGKLPLDPRIGWCCDQGKSFLSEVPDSPAAQAYQEIIQSESLMSTATVSFRLPCPGPSYVVWCSRIFLCYLCLMFFCRDN